MDSRYSISQEFHNVQMDLKQVHIVQQNHAERLSRLEKRQTDDAALKSVWNSPFPSVLGGTPQNGPVKMPPNEAFDDFDEQGQNLLGSLHLDADDEPVRRGAASRANSVRFDESALQGSNWGQNSRHSGDFGPTRPGSAFGGHPLMERSLSHKSDGRHSSTGQSVHSLHSVASGRNSSLGLDTAFLGAGREDESPVDVPEPPPGFFVLGSVPSIIRCWLDTNFANDTLLYAVLCTGSQKSVVEYSLIRELDLTNHLQRDLDGVHRIRLPVYLTEASVLHSSSRSGSPAPPIPSITANFEVIGVDLPENTEGKKRIRVFIGSDTLRAHSADLLLSQNTMCLYGNERDKLSVPFVRPEDDGIFKNLITTSGLPERTRLNATAAPFVSAEAKMPNMSPQQRNMPEPSPAPTEPQPEPWSPAAEQLARSVRSEDGSEGAPLKDAANGSEYGGKAETVTSQQSDGGPRDPAGGIWSSWRQGPAANGSDGSQRDNSLSGYQAPTRQGRNMKILKPQKSGGSSSARTGAAYEPAPLPRPSGENRRKSQASVTMESISTPTNAVRWDNKRSLSSGSVLSMTNGGDGGTGKKDKNLPTVPRSANPVGGASAFSWMNSRAAKPKATT